MDQYYYHSVPESATRYRYSNKGAQYQAKEIRPPKPIEVKLTEVKDAPDIDDAEGLEKAYETWKACCTNLNMDIKNKINKQKGVVEILTSKELAKADDMLKPAKNAPEVPELLLKSTKAYYPGTRAEKFKKKSQLVKPQSRIATIKYKSLRCLQMYWLPALVFDPGRSNCLDALL
ncbi:19233_t:CDS:2 [Gigaspora rosea]|nr:19233_t:CDS:2 [Gigaspora rosea]